MRIRIPLFLKNLSYRPSIQKLVRVLHLGPIARRLYCRWAWPANSIFQFESNDLRAQFYIRTPDELRMMESERIKELRMMELLISDLKPGDTVYDVGAAVGLYTIVLAKILSNKGQVIAFEPNRQSCNRLQDNLRLNGLTNVRLFCKALGEENRKEKLYTGKGILSTLIQPLREIETDYEFVEMAEGDRLREAENLPFPRVVKIDVEGYEYAVIQGLQQTLRQPTCKLVCCEIHPQLLPVNVKPEMILDLLKSLGFSQIEIHPCRGRIEYHAICYKPEASVQLRERKLRILVSAFACLKDPDRRFGDGGEGVLGWNIVRQLARFHQIFVLAHSQNRTVIETALKKESLHNINFYYFDLSRWLQFLQKFPGGIQLYAYLWQIKAYFVARKLHQKFHFDVFHHITYANDWMASFIGALLPIPYIRGPGGGAHRVPKKFLSEFSFFGRFSQYLRSIGQWFFRQDPFFVLGQRRAKAILVCNRESLEAIPKKWQDKTYLFSVNGISNEDLDLLSKSEKKDNNKFRVLTAGKLLPIKGFSLAIKAFKIFSDKIEDGELEIIGDGPEFPRLKNLVFKLGIEDKVHFKKWMVRNEFLKELKSCDVFLFPSLRDGGGQVVIEAMTSGLPVICLDIAGPGFHIKNEWGIKIKPHFPEQAIREIAEVLEKLYFDKELRIRLGKVARERAEKEYHWDRLGEKLLKIYQCIMPDTY